MFKQYVERAALWYCERADRAIQNTFGGPSVYDGMPHEPYESVSEETKNQLGSPTLSLFWIVGLVFLTALIIADALVSTVERVIGAR